MASYQVWSITVPLVHICKLIATIKNCKNELYKTSKDKFRTKYVSIFEIYSISKKYKGYKVGDTYLYNTIKYGMAEQYKGTIIGLGIDMLLLKDINGNIRLVEYSN